MSWFIYKLCIKLTKDDLKKDLKLRNLNVSTPRNVLWIQRSRATFITVDYSKMTTYS